MENEQINVRLLLEGCLNGNRRSQRRLYESFYGYGMKICMRYGANRNEAAEILNDGFMKVFSKLHQYDASYPFKAWLRRILINQSIDQFRSQLKKPKLVNWDEIALPFMSIENRDDELSDNSVVHLIQHLPPTYRMVFNLYVMEEYKHHEIAEMLNISSSSSRSNLTRAKEILRRMVKKRSDKDVNFR